MLDKIDVYFYKQLSDSYVFVAMLSDAMSKPAMCACVGGGELSLSHFRMHGILCALGH